MLVTDEEAEKEKRPFRRGLLIAGFTVIALFVFAFSAWSRMAPIESAVIAPGIVRVESGLRNIQHLEGGIISRLNVAEGEQVEAGEPLILLQETATLASRASRTCA